MTMSTEEGSTHLSSRLVSSQLIMRTCWLRPPRPMPSSSTAGSVVLTDAWDTEDFEVVSGSTTFSIDRLAP